jgi:hypothetical protein
VAILPFYCWISNAAFTIYGGWGSELIKKSRDLYYKEKHKAAKASGGDGWEMINNKTKLFRHVAELSSAAKTRACLVVLLACASLGAVSSHVGAARD